MIEQWYREMPVVTRTYLTLALLTSAACHFDFISPLHLYFNPVAITQKYQLWRLLTSFLFFGSFGLDFVFHMFFLVRYCRMLEEGEDYRRDTAEFVYMVFIGAVLMTIIAFVPAVKIHFLGSSLTFMMVYVWGRKNKNVRMSFLGLFNFTAPYLPWVLLGFSIMLGNSASVDLIGIAAGHTYYFFRYVYPILAPGRQPLKAPQLLRDIFDQYDNVQPMMYDFTGEGRAVGGMPIAGADDGGAGGQQEGNE